MPLQATSGAASYDGFGGGVPPIPTYIEEVFSTYLYTGIKGISPPYDPFTHAYGYWTRSSSSDSNPLGGTEGILRWNGVTLYANNPFSSRTINGVTYTVGAWKGFTSDGNDNYFNRFEVTATSGNPLQITNNIDLSTKGGMVWFKSRDQAYGHGIVDTVRGTSNTLQTNNTNSQQPFGPLSSYNTTGFTLAEDPNDYLFANGEGTKFSSWTFRKQPKFFDVVTYTGNGTGQAIAHNLGSTPGFIIVKRTNTTGDWAVYHRSVGVNAFQFLNLTQATNYASSFWSTTAPTSTTFNVSTNSSVNASGSTYVAYLFAHNAGGFGLSGADNVISCGSYTGNGSSTGPTITLGYEPQWVMVKRTDSTSNWFMLDIMRGIPNTPGVAAGSAYLFPDSSNAEDSAYAPFAALSATGFSLLTSNANLNASGGSYIYIAIRRGPMKVPTDATKVFQPVISTSSGGAASNTSVLSYADWSLGKGKASPYAFQMSSRLQGQVWMQTSSTSAESSDGNYNWAKQNYIPFAWGASASDIITYGLLRAPSFFDVVCYTGDGTADSRTFTHNLGVTPQLVIVRRRSSTSDWVVTFNTAHAVLLNSTNADTGYSDATGNYANGILVGTNATTLTQYSGASGNTACNASGNTYVAYLFATCAGVSKVGSYTGTGTTLQVNCGFTGGARFVLIKRTDLGGAWYVWDSVRGIVSGNDPYLLLNSTAAEVTNTDYLNTYSAGFEISSTAPAAINASGGTFIYLAIA